MLAETNHATALCETMTCRLGHHKEGRIEVGLLRPFLFVRAFQPVLMLKNRTVCSILPKIFHISFDIREFKFEVQRGERGDLNLIWTGNGTNTLVS
jgi:hypothetical protein